MPLPVLVAEPAPDVEEPPNGVARGALFLSCEEEVEKDQGHYRERRREFQQPDKTVVGFDMFGPVRAARRRPAITRHNDLPDYFAKSCWPSQRRDSLNEACGLCNDRRTLLWFANQLAVEYHPALARIDHPDRATDIVLDLDPPEGASFAAPVRDMRRVVGSLRQSSTSSASAGPAGRPARS